jgi:solute:Na+ symporter, SSS family
MSTEYTRIAVHPFQVAQEPALHSVYLYTLTAFFIVMMVIAFWARRKVTNVEDFIIAGRQLSVPLLSGTLIATWFGAGSLSVSADTIFHHGLRMTALEPLGLGFCLIFAGCFFARRIWHLQVLTLADIIRLRFGVVAEKLEVVISIAYLGWIAVQLLSIGHIIELVFGFDATTSIIVVTLILTSYTLLGGMWSVTLTDLVQVSLLVIGLIILCGNILASLGQDDSIQGFSYLLQHSDRDALVLIPTEKLADFQYWLSLFLLGSLGNIASQDLTQRILAAKSPSTAVNACLFSGGAYILIASIPVVIGLAGRLLLNNPDAPLGYMEANQIEGIVPLLAHEYLSPWMSVIFLLTMTAAITSSVDSALLAPASIFAQNFLKDILGSRFSTLTLTRYAIVAVACASAALALSGAHAMDLLQSSYLLGLTPLVVLAFGLYQRRTYALPAILTLLLGLFIWFYHMAHLLFPAQIDELPLPGWLPLPLSVLLLTVATYLISHCILVATRRRHGIGVIHDNQTTN